MLFKSVLALTALAGQCLSLPTIEAKGAKFFTSDGKQFFLKGIAYQLTPNDPLVSTSQCLLDAALMKTLGANSIRVYHVDPLGSHDGCMKAFSDAGIYAWIDLDTFTTYITPSSLKWTNTMYNAYRAVMDVFQKYDNTAGFFVGNEILTRGNESAAAPFIKAAARDLKAYRDSKGYRKIPIGYSAADIADLRPNLQNYMACGSNSSESLDFFGLNAYEWCGNSNYMQSGYDALQKNASSYNIPIFFSETGCREPAPRLFTDQSAIFGQAMSGTWSGAIIYEWIEEVNNYGLISYGPKASATGVDIEDGYTRTGAPTPVLPDFTNLSNQWKTLSPTGVSLNAYTPSLTPPPCPAYTQGFWEVQGNVALPSLGATFSGSVAGAITGTTSRSAATTTSSGVANAVHVRGASNDVFVVWALSIFGFFLGIPLAL